MPDTFLLIEFVADELLTSTKMNQMAANQAGFNSGDALGDGIILSRHIGGGTITPDKLEPATAASIPIEAKTLATATAAVTFSSIPQIYTHLKLFCWAWYSSTAIRALIAINGNTTASNYVHHEHVSIGSSITSSETLNSRDCIVLSGSAEINANPITCRIPQYRSAGKKWFIYDNPRDDGARYLVGYNRINFTPAVTSIEISIPSGTIQAGSKFYLYGEN